MDMNRMIKERSARLAGLCTNFCRVFTRFGILGGMIAMLWIVLMQSS